jgi:hypothetical protein
MRQSNRVLESKTFVRKNGEIYSSSDIGLKNEGSGRFPNPVNCRPESLFERECAHEILAAHVSRTRAQFADGRTALS